MIVAHLVRRDLDGVFSNYNLTPQYDKRFFTNEVYKASKGEKDNDLKHWDTLRPIPLTLEERRDYVKKDSIQIVHQSKPYLDSVNRKNNRFTFGSLLTGYTYRNSWERTSITIGSPISVINFNPVQGWNLTSPMVFEKQYGERFKPYKSSLKIAPSVNYSFLESRIRAALAAEYLFNRFNYSKLTLEGGKTVAQFNENNPISSIVAELYALYGKRNYSKIYDKTFFKINYGQEIVNGLRFEGGFEWQNRVPLSNGTEFSFRLKERVYDINLPNHPFLLAQLQGQELLFQTHDAVFLNAKLTWQAGQKYASYPNYKENEGSKYPTFTLVYQKCLGRLVTDHFFAAPFDRLRLSIQQKQITMGLFGYTELRGEVGGFLKKKNIQFIDYQHFKGNESNIAKTESYMTGFLNLPYYRYSTTGNYFMLHAQHNFEGYIFDKLPLIRKLGFKEIFRVAYLNTPELGNYTELGFGIDNIGIALFRFLRLDVSWQLKGREVSSSPVFMIGVKL